jgi:hypothetical protein
VEGLGQLARWELSGGQAHDLTQAHTLILGIRTYLKFCVKDRWVNSFLSAQLG